MRQRLIILTALVASLLALVLGGVAWANIPGSNGVISACQKNNDGSLRVIDAEAGQRCPAGYSTLNWNQTGPAGATGKGITGVYTTSHRFTIQPLSVYPHAQAFKVNTVPGKWV